jgi:uncharacterized membrane protein YhaH (DUF805 family)
MLTFFRTKGRLNRIEFVIYSLILFLLFIANYYITTPQRLFYYFIAFTLLFSYLTQSVKRAHDFNGPGYLYFFWVFIPFFSLYALFELYLRKGESFENKYGKPSKLSLEKKHYVQKENKTSLADDNRNLASSPHIEEKEEKKAEVILSERITETSIIIKLKSNRC